MNNSNYLKGFGGSASRSSYDYDGYDYEYDDAGNSNYHDPYPQEHQYSYQENFNSYPQQSRQAYPPNKNFETGSMSNVVRMLGGNRLSEVAILEPRSFEEIPQVLKLLREQKTVVLNLTHMDPDQAQRAVDFIAGGTHAIDGNQQRICENVFLFTSNSVQINVQQPAMSSYPCTPEPPERMNYFYNSSMQ